MTKRKQTPDVLAEILGGNGPAEVAVAEREGRLTAAAQKHTPLHWEYAVVSFQDYKGWRPRYLNGRELKDWTAGPLMHEYLAAMDEEGWELTTASAGERLYGTADQHQLFFRRLK